MFKSAFVRYISFFILIIVLSIFLSVSVITLLVNNYDTDDKKRAIENISKSAVDFTTDDVARSGKDFDNYIRNSNGVLTNVFKALMVNTDHTAIMIADDNGIVRMLTFSDSSRLEDEEKKLIAKSKTGIILSDLFVKRLRENELLTENGTLDGIFSENLIYNAKLLKDGTGKPMGILVTCAMSKSMDTLLESMIKTIVISSLWLSLAMLVVVYFITDRQISPLREMSKAAREFAAGRYDSRITVSGTDEVAELAEAFNSMADSMQRSDETRRMFLANVSHDLRTPMTTISGFVDSIKDGVIPEDKVPYYLGVISSEVKRLSRLVSSLLDITKIQAGERKFVMTPFDICEMAREIIISSDQRLEEKKLDVVFEAGEDNMYVNADHDAIYQVMYNLCDNAIKFSREGGEYRITIKHDGSKVLFEIFNEGEGIAEQDLPYVFDRFYKSDKSRGLDKTGVGLGLYISRTIIEQHGEKIHVESEHGKWCRFYFTLPRANAPQQGRKSERS